MVDVSARLVAQASLQATHLCQIGVRGLLSRLPHRFTFPKMYVNGRESWGIFAEIVPLKAQTSARPTIENGKVAPPIRRKNRDSRPREYLTPDEVARLMSAAGQAGRHPHRDRTLVLMMFRHGLRVSEAAALRWDMVDLRQGLIHVQRLKNGVPSVHPLRGPQLRALRRLRRDYPETPYLFATERGGPMTGSGVRKILARAGRDRLSGASAHAPAQHRLQAGE